MQHVLQFYLTRVILYSLNIATTCYAICCEAETSFCWDGSCSLTLATSEMIGKKSASRWVNTARQSPHLVKFRWISPELQRRNMAYTWDNGICLSHSLSIDAEAKATGLKSWAKLMHSGLLDLCIVLHEHNLMIHSKNILWSSVSRRQSVDTVAKETCG